MKKTCFKCGSTKSIDDFYRHPQMGDGYLGKCKTCTRLDVRARRAENREYYNEYDRKRHCAERATKSKKPHMAVANAIRDKRLVKPNNCQSCGKLAERKTDIVAHHHDYSKPLDVKWLCRQCHGAEHAREGWFNPSIPDMSIDFLDMREKGQLKNSLLVSNF